MSRKLVPAILAFVSLGTTAIADVPSVAVDIAPVHSLVARVMDGVGTPDLVIPSGASPHEHRLRPSEAAALENAEIVFWVGEDLTPWLQAAIETLAEDASVTGLLDAEDTVRLAFREGAMFEAHDHEESADHDHSHDDHGHGQYDPHAWLSPDNASAWLDLIAVRLSEVDPDNAGSYFANAAAGREELKALKGEITAILDPIRGKRFLVFHDAYQYFETAFDFPAAGAISLSDATDPSPARIAEIQAQMAEQAVDCVLAEPQFNPGLVATVMDGTDVATGVLDPLGSALEPGEDMYPRLLRNLASALADCL